MRAIRYPLFAILALLVGCASPKKSALHYSAPSTAPVQEKITDAKTAVTDVSTAIADAQTALQTSDLRSPTSERVGHALTLAEQRANDAAVALAAAGNNTLLLDSAVRNQTDVLNRTIDEKNSAITERDSAVGKYHHLKFWICLLAAGAVLSLAWRFKSLLLFIPPPYNLVAIGALPVLTFAFLWIRL